MQNNPTSHGDAASRIEASLRDLLKAERAEVTDESRAHAGHAGAGDGGHYRVFVVSALFEELSRIDRHRAVYRAVAASGVETHAVAVRALTPSEYQALG